eukprot:2883579-Alexandrium_andersonii.AAC.1
MSASLVGSEMCIRDSVTTTGRGSSGVARAARRGAACKCFREVVGASEDAVSYTHLTLPTICSV